MCCVLMQQNHVLRAWLAQRKGVLAEVGIVWVCGVWFVVLSPVTVLHHWCVGGRCCKVSNQECHAWLSFCWSRCKISKCG